MLDDRFWTKVEKAGPTECWNWRANKNNKGYGLFRPGGSLPKQLAHRLAFEDAKGRIPSGALILHSCDNPACVNPRHLRVGDHVANVADMDERNRRVVVAQHGSANPNASLTESAVREMRADYLNGSSRDDLSRKFGISPQSVQDITSGDSWRHILTEDEAFTLKAFAQGKLKSNALLTPALVRTIRARLKAGAKGIDLAAEFGVHKATISDIKLRKIWADL